MADLRIWLVQRGKHNIDDELIFSSYDSYVFHDSCGFEAGSEDELGIVKAFLDHRLHERRLKNRLHVIWFARLVYNCLIAHSQGIVFRYCVSMVTDRPSLNLRHFKDICPDRNGTSKHFLMKWDRREGFSKFP
jgi:hypothetical protein